MALENFKIRIVLALTKSINPKLKEQFKNELIKNYPFKGFDTKRDLFYMGMYSRIYDLYTSSIFSLALKNSISLSCLLRAQLENIALIMYLIENPSKIDRVFIKTDFDKAQKQLGKLNLLEYYGKLTQRAHPFHEGLKSSFGDIAQISPKPGTSNELTPETLVGITSEKFKEMFEMLPLISCDAVPHNSIKSLDIPKASKNILDFYLLAKSKLDELYKILPETKVSDYREFWKKHNRKN